MNEATRNEEVLAWVETLGGDYVWEDDLFAITLLDVPIEPSQVDRLLAVEGLDQLTLDASRLRSTDLRRLAGMAGLGSLVVAGRALTANEVADLRDQGPEVDLVAD